MCCFKNSLETTCIFKKYNSSESMSMMNMYISNCCTWPHTSICSSLWNTFSRVGLSCSLMASCSARCDLSKFSSSPAVSLMMSSKIISARTSPRVPAWNSKKMSTFQHFFFKYRPSQWEVQYSSQWEVQYSSQW